MLDTELYIAVQLTVTPESHFREDRHTAKDKKNCSHTFVIMLYYTKSCRK